MEYRGKAQDRPRDTNDCDATTGGGRGLMRKLCLVCGVPLSPDEQKECFGERCHKCLHEIFVKAKKRKDGGK